MILLATAVLTVSVYGQGTVNFNTLALGTSAQVYDDAAHGGYLLGSTNYGPGAQGTNWFAQLYAAAGTGVPSSALVPVGQPVNFRGGINAGYVQTSGTTTLGWKVNPIVTVPLLSSGGPATIQLRVWWGGGTLITSYEAATASSHPNSRWGASPLLYLATTGNPIASPPTPPADLIGLLDFRIGETESFRPPSITIQPQSRLTFVGANVLLTVGVNGSPPLSYQWSYNGTNIAGATLSSLALANVQMADSGSYAVVARNAFGSVASSNADLTIVLVPPCAAPPFGLVGWWGGEGNTLDYVSGNNGVAQTGMPFTSGVAGQCFVFNGTNSSVKIPASPSLDVGQADGFTIEAWINPVTVWSQQPIVEWNSGSGNNPCGAHFWLSANVGSGPGCLFANLVDTAGVGHWVISAPGLVTANSFQHVALTYDKTAGLAAIYLNGVAVAQTKVGRFTPQTAYDLYWGLRPGGIHSGTRYQGKMDEVSLYRRALSAGEIQFLYDAGGSGKCEKPLSIVSQPVSLWVNEGTDAHFNVVAAGNPVLHYQWFKDGLLLPGETGGSLTLTDVQDAQAGLYSVRVTNWFGSVISSNALLRVNYPPVADASATLSVVISANHSNASVVLNGTRSSDPDNDPLQYHWFQAGTANVLATGMVAVVTLPLGTHAITLVVDDGLATGTHTITAEVITPMQAMERLKEWLLAQSGVRLNARGGVQIPQVQPLVASLVAAIASLERGNPTVAINQLHALQEKVRAQVAPADSALADQLILAVQQVIDILGGGSDRERVRFTAIHRHANGKVRLHFPAKRGPVYVVETSTDLVSWEKLGVAADGGNGLFEFEDANAARTPTRFYRVVAP